MWEGQVHKGAPRACAPVVSRPRINSWQETTTSRRNNGGEI